MSADPSDYTVQENDTLSSIAAKQGVPWQAIAKTNGIDDPRTLQVGQNLKIPKKAGKVHANILDAAHNPLPGVRYQIKGAGKTTIGKTPASGQTQDFLADFESQDIEFFIQKLNGDWKKVHETTAHAFDKLITLVSPRLKLSSQTLPHPSGTSDDQSALAPKPKASPVGSQTSSTFAAGKGIKTEQTTDKNGAPVLKLTSDDADWDEFLDKYNKQRLSEQDFSDAAKQLNVEVAAIKAVHRQECGDDSGHELPSSFRNIDGRVVPTILYERHKFFHECGGKYWDTNPDLSFPVPYYLPGATYAEKTMALHHTDGSEEDVKVWSAVNPKKAPVGSETGKYLFDTKTLDKAKNIYGNFSYIRLKKAYRLDPNAALKACSWGAFQILGQNYVACGFSSVADFARAMSRSEIEHLKAFVQFVLHNPGMHRALEDLDFSKFASLYNGPQYKANQYDTRMKGFYDEFKKQPN